MRWIVGLLLVVAMAGCGGGGSSSTTNTTGTTNTAPVANAGNAQSVAVGALVTLDGSGSSDANGDPLTYSWSFTSKPTGSNAVLSSSTSAKPTFTADVAGAYVLSLVVNDGKVNSTPSSVTVTSAPSKVRSKIVLEGAVAASVSGIYITLTLPPGMSVAADASGVVNSGIVTMLPPNDTTSYSAASYNSTTRKLTIGIQRGAVPFSAGDFFTVTCDVEAGVSTQNMVISVDGLKGYDKLGAEITPMPTATASL